MTPRLCAMARHVGRGALAALLTLALSPTLSATQPAQAQPGSPAGETGTLTAAQKAAAEQAAVRKEALTRVRAHRQAIGQQISAAVAKGDQAALQTAVARYRQAVTAELLLEAADLHGDARAEFLRRQQQEARARYDKLRQDAKAYLINRLPAAGSDAERTKIQASVEDTLHQARARLEMASEALRRTYTVNTTQVRLKELLDRISSNYVEEPLRPSYGISHGNIQGAPEAERRAEHWLRLRQREADVSEYVRLARGGIVLDPETGAVIQGTERQRIARNAEQQLVEALKRANLNEGVLANLMGFADTRGNLAAERDADIKASDEYRALDFIRSSLEGAGAQEVLRALALAVRHEQTRINDWRAKRIPEGGEGGITGWLYENFVAKQKVGLGRASEIGDWGLTKDSLEEIDRRIAIFQRDADAVVEAFSAAARTPNPRDLLQTETGRRHHRLLERYGYIAKGKDGAQRYEIPTDARVSARLARDLRLPGGSWLDIISGANVIKLVLLAAAPELAAARLGVLLEGLELGAGTVRIGTLAADALAGTALDAGIQRYVEGQTVEADKLAIESLFLAPVIQGVSRLAGEASSAVAALLKDRTRREAAEKFLTQTLGLASETALQSYWQAQLQGKLTYEDFLSNLINGAISRGARGALEGTYNARSRAVDSIRGYRGGRVTLPEAVGQILRGDEGRAARAEILSRAEESQQRFDEAVRNLKNVIGDDMSHPDAPVKLVTALENGQYSWADLKMLYRNDPDKLRPLMAAANEARARFSETIVAKARIRAREQIHREYRERVQKLTDALKETDQLRPALEQAAAWRDQQLELLQRDPFAPGSKDLTSDIDRSAASPYFRNALKRLTDEAFTEDGRRLPPTSARAYDLNEYIDVFPVIKRTKQIDLTRETAPGFGALTHYQAVEAGSLSAAMLHMTPAERARFKDNALRAADPANRRTLEVQFDYAEQSLRRGDQELQAEVDRLVRQGADRSSADAVVRARDNLYGERTQRLGDLEAQLGRLDPNSAEAKRLAAEIEREWSYTLREGIETYSTFAGLEAIVIQGQLKDRSIRNLIDAPAFNAQALNLRPEQARAILNDQVLMIVEHIHAFNRGHESTLDAASALGKYAERAVLALKLTGVDVSTGPVAELSRISDLLVQARKDPAKLQEQIAKYGNGDADQGLINLSTLLQRALPGLDGLFDPKLLHTAATDGAGARAGETAGRTLAQVRAQLALQREREQERERARAHYGSGQVARTVADRIGRMEQELASLRAQKARDDRLRATYRRDDWTRAESLESERASLVRQRDLLPNRETASAVATGLNGQIARVDGDLSVLRRRRGDTPASPTEAEARRDRRITSLEQQVQQARAELKRDQERAVEEAKAADVRPVVTQAGSAIDLDFPSRPDRPIRPSVDVDTRDAPELGRAGALLFGDLDRERLYPENRTPHEPAPTGTTLRTAAPADAPSSRPAGERVARPAETGTPASPETAVAVGGGFTAATSVPPLAYELTPGGEESSSTSLDLDDMIEELAFDLFSNPGLVGGPAGAGTPRDPTVQRMISVIDDLEPIVVLAGERSGAPRESRGGVWAGLRRLLNWPGQGAAAARGGAVPVAPGARITGSRSSLVLAPLALPPQGVGSAPNAQTGAVQMLVTSLGTSTGEAFEVRIVNDGDRPVRITGGSLVLEPIAREAQDRIQRQVQQIASGGNTTTFKLTAYCLEFFRRPPSAGTLFRIAGSELQQQFAPMGRILEAGRRLQAAGLLTPDSDPADYFHAIRQWAIWTEEQGFDLKSFTKAWVEHPKKQFTEQKQPWSSAAEKVLRSAAPGRWRDIASVLRAAELHEERPAGSGGL
jgi:hypothetical protein